MFILFLDVSPSKIVDKDPLSAVNFPQVNNHDFNRLFRIICTMVETCVLNNADLQPLIEIL